jgi:hypothetical protein
MPKDSKGDHNKLVTSWLREWKLEIFGIADLVGLETPVDERNIGFPRAISFAVLMNPEIMKSIQSGPNQDHTDEYSRVNTLIDTIAAPALKELFWPNGL